MSGCSGTTDNECGITFKDIMFKDSLLVVSVKCFLDCNVGNIALKRGVFVYFFHQQELLMELWSLTIKHHHVREELKTHKDGAVEKKLTRWHTVCSIHHLTMCLILSKQNHTKKPHVAVSLEFRFTLWDNASYYLGFLPVGVWQDRVASEALNRTDFTLQKKCPFVYNLDLLLNYDIEWVRISVL